MGGRGVGGEGRGEFFCLFFFCFVFLPVVFFNCFNCQTLDPPIKFSEKV